MFQQIKIKESTITMKEIIYGVILSITTILTPIKPFIFLIGLFVLLDTALGVYSTVKTKGLKYFRSNKLFNIVVKSFFYMLTVVLSFLVDTYIFGGSLLGISNLIMKTLSILILYIELKSIDENLIKLGNKSLWIQLKEMISKGKELKHDLGELIEDDKKDDDDSEESKEK